jgi:hypothetical protein
MNQIFNFFKFSGGIPGQRFQTSDIFVEGPFQDMGKQLFLAFKMIVNERLGDTGFARNLQRCGAVIPLFGKQPNGGVDQILFFPIDIIPMVER